MIIDHDIYIYIYEHQYITVTSSKKHIYIYMKKHLVDHQYININVVLWNIQADVHRLMKLMITCSWMLMIH